ncbi:hypothetical protein LXH13_06305 [Streptomyces spinosirectus]|jgi:hypothetical protein|uniref:hypothetical protein n=1 Tax=Streptomyces TaxID=1883 RepID=UPI001C9D8B2B|nr:MULTISPECIES: hypothetical protein [Streptomyces]MBY8341982.1 hypothetical protein [Streptomyces plumbidurans]UIR16670.1 hypothetical protein LXH13_06305 [Streptomyces spinosirectus]
MRVRIAVATLGMSAVAFLTACSSGSADPDGQGAAVTCESFVKDRLKSPGSAKFPGVTDPDYAKIITVSGKKPWKYQINGYVDSDNSFGASVRSDYVCTVSTKNGDTWHLDYMRITERQ